MFDRAVKLPDDYFKKDKRQYSNWIFAFFRELLQNSIDAGAININISISSTDKTVEVTFTDDGCGMDEAALFDGFLCMGGSIKSEGSIGGFGQAKIIILFAHESYEIITRDNIIEGVGGNYSHRKIPSYNNGTKIRVVMEKDYSSNESRLTEELYTLLQNSSLDEKIKITLNDEGIYSNGKFKKGLDLSSLRFNHPTSIGDVKFDDQQGRESSLWIRINGLAMFKHSIWMSDENASGFYGVIDLNKDSPTILTANRDSLNSHYSSSLNSIFKELSSERSSLKTTNLIDFTFNDEDNFISRLAKITKEFEDVKNTNQQPKVSRRVYGENKPFADLSSRSDSPFAVEIKKAQDEHNKINRVFDKIKRNLYPSSFKVKKSACSKDTYSKMATILNQSKVIKGAHQWVAVMSNILATEYFKNYGVIFIDYSGNQAEYSPETDGQFYFYNKRISFGFIFSETFKGSCISKEDSIEIMINPNAIKEMDMIGDIIDIGTHEAAHILNSYHDENFCSTEIEIRKSLRRKTKESIIASEGKKMHRNAIN